MDQAAEQWRTDGWVLLDGLLPAEEVNEARCEIEGRRMDPPEFRSSRPAEEVLARDPAFRSEQFSGTVLFPVPDAPLLNRLFVHPELAAFARRAMGIDDIRIYQSRLWSKFGDRTNYEQPLHRDGNHSLVPVRSEPGWWFMECFVYLQDVDDANGAPRLVPLSVPGAAEPAGRRPLEPGEAPDLYEAEVTAPGAIGSVLAYRSDVWHRGTDIAPGAERHVLAISYKPAGHEWIGFDPHPPLAVNGDFIEFVGSCGPEELALFGVPRLGHPFWTVDTVDRFARMYRTLDVEPWRRALSG